jgi:hypothetical protein
MINSFQIRLDLGIQKRSKKSIFIVSTQYVQPARNGRQVLCGMRQSMSSSSIANWAALTLILPLLTAGQTKRPRSSRLENKHTP